MKFIVKVPVLAALVILGCYQPLWASLDTTLTVSRHTLPLKQALEELDRQSNYTFSYSSRIPLEQEITFGKTTASLRYFLNHISKEQLVTYREAHNKVFITKAKKRTKVPPSSALVDAALSGYVRDATNGEALIGATVYVQDLEKGTVTNVYGYYVLSLPPGTYTLACSYLGYQTQHFPVQIEADQTLDIELAPEDTQLEEVVISADKMPISVQEIEMSTEKVDIQTIQKMPALLGEVDVIRSIQLLPGVSTVGEGAPGFNVRGGSIDQNLILLDEAPVFSSSHLLGFFSVFNPDAVKDIKLYKGGIPARYGGRLSSVLDVRQKDGNAKRFGAKGGIGLISSRLMVEAPIRKDKGSFMLAGRRSYGDLFLRMSNNEEVNNTIVYFYDLNTKANYKINDRNQLFLSGYFGRDVFSGALDGARFAWGNSTGTLRWNHLFSKKLFANFTAIYSDYNYELGVENTGGSIEAINWRSDITSYSAKGDFSFFPSLNDVVDFGVSGTRYRLNPGDVRIESTATDTENGLKVEEEHAIEAGIYISHDKKLSDRITLEYGLRYTAFLNVGERDVFTYVNGIPSPDNAITDTTSYGSNEIIKFYDGLEPRFAFNYSLNDENAFKLSYNRIFQYMQLVSNTTAATPLDIWTPANRYIRPARVDQVALGYFRTLMQGSVELSAEVYYKYFNDLIDFRNGAELLLNENLETELLSGEGRAYGLELQLKKQTGRWTGWISYTLARTERQVDGINNDQYYPSNYDKPHDVSLVLNYEISPKWNASANFAYMTGRPITYPAGRFEVDGLVVPDYTDRNGARTPDYHRLDLSINYEPSTKPGRRWQSSWNFGVYNVYARRNPYSVFFRQNDINPAATEAVQLSIFANIIPSITYNFTF